MLCEDKMTSSLMSYSAALSLLSEPCACLKLVKATKHITLLPKFIGNFAAGINQVLSSEIKLFSKQLDGVLVTYSKVQRQQTYASMFEHNPHLHMDVNADFIVFKPTVGAILKGVINKQSSDHIGILVHNCFNGSVRKSSVATESIVLGQTVTFRVTDIYTTNRIVSFNGDLTKESMDELSANKPSAKRSASESFNSDDVNGDATRPKKKRKKDKERDRVHKQNNNSFMDTSAFNSTDEELSKKQSKDKPDTNDPTMETLNSTEDGLSPRSAKKKKKKDKKEKSKREISPVPMELNNDVSTLDESSSHSAKKKKKHKKEKFEQETSPIAMEFNQDNSTTSTPKSKKKKNKRKEEIA